MSTVEFAFEENLARAATLPSAWYADAAIFQQEKERIFSRTWNLVGRAAQVAEPGDYFTTAIADEPIIVARGADAELRAFANVCRHRAGPVAAGEGNRKVFQCGYHGWTYALDGRLLGTPEFDGVECFDKAANCLPEFAVEKWGALVFVNLDRHAAPLAETLDDLGVRLAAHDLSAMRFAARKEWLLDCNWKTYVDNYLEGYHIPVVHPALNRELDYQNYRTETGRYYSMQHAPLRQTPDARLRHAASADDDKAQFIWVFPNLMLNVYPDNYSTNLIVPLGPERTLTLFEWYFHDPECDGVQEKLRRTIEFSDEVQIEDIRICEAVQRGLRSRTYRAGRYSVKRENGVHHFHRLIAECFAQG
jgi:choline monooxygenase